MLRTSRCRTRICGRHSKSYKPGCSRRGHLTKYQGSYGTQFARSGLLIPPPPVLPPPPHTHTYHHLAPSTSHPRASCTAPTCVSTPGARARDISWVFTTCPMPRIWESVQTPRSIHAPGSVLIVAPCLVCSRFFKVPCSTRRSKVARPPLVPWTKAPELYLCLVRSSDRRTR